jgi:hypothetical protein
MGASTTDTVQAAEFFDSFDKLKNFVDRSLDEFKDELQRVVFPVFVCLFLYMMLR